MKQINNKDLENFLSNIREENEINYNWYEVDALWREANEKNRHTEKFENVAGLNFVYKLSYELAIRNPDILNIVNLLDSIFSFYKKYYNPQQNTFKEIESYTIFIEKLTDEINCQIENKIVDEILDCIINEAISEIKYN